MVIKFQFPRVSVCDQPLAKEPEDSGYEIAKAWSHNTRDHLEQEVAGSLTCVLIQHSLIYRCNYSLSMITTLSYDVTKQIIADDVILIWIVKIDIENVADIGKLISFS